MSLDFMCTVEFFMINLSFELSLFIKTLHHLYPPCHLAIITEVILSVKLLVYQDFFFFKEKS